MASIVVGMGTNTAHMVRMNPADMPAPTILTMSDAKGASGWIYFQVVEIEDLEAFDVDRSG